eukprot:8823338-Pyramimonas_sp.AAC.1
MIPFLLPPSLPPPPPPLPPPPSSSPSSFSSAWGPEDHAKTAQDALKRRPRRHKKVPTRSA